jgi:acyl-CoA synthetase (AMP-forming)/AMP-acid ligase II
VSQAPLFDWLERPPPGRGLRFAGTDDDWDFWSYQRLAEAARRVAHTLRENGVGRGDGVLVICPASAQFVAYFYGTLLAGAVPTPVAGPSTYQDREHYRDHLVRLGALVGARAALVDDTAAPEARTVADTTGWLLLEQIPAGPTFDGPATPELAVVQFSSGSTGPQKGVRIPRAAMGANVRAIRDWLQFDPDRGDGFASWLPVYHDMGLVGGLVFPMAYGADLWLLRPEQFIRHPLRWLRCFAPGLATTTTTATLGLTQLLRRVRPEHLAGLDLSGMRTLIVGAERVEEGVVRAVADLLRPCGFDPAAVLPAYGLAESTLAVNGVRHADRRRTVAVDPASLMFGERVRAVPDDDPGGTTLVGCGRPLGGMTTTVVDDDGHALGDGILGEIEVRGASVAEGYVGGPRFDGVLRTGDAGFLVDGELFVVGRLGDCVKLFGRWLFAEDVERVAQAVSPRPGRTVCLLGALDGRNTAAVVIEGAAGAGAAAVGVALRRHFAELRILVVTAPTGWIQRTTSGKAMRRPMWQRLTAERGALPVAWNSDDPVTTREESTR